MLSSATTYRPDLSIVVPVYNSVASLRPLYKRLAAVCAAAGKSFEVIFVHDGGSKQSWEMITAIKADHAAQVTAIQLGRNYGQHNATLCGIDHSQGELILTIDDDLQNPPEEIPKLLAAMEDPDIDMAYGIPIDKKHSTWRNWGSAAFKKVFRYLARGLKDGSSYRLMRRTIAEKIGQHREQFVFLDQIIAWYTVRVAYIPVKHDLRSDGQSGYSGLKLFEMAIKTIILYTDLPLRLMIWSGLLASILSLIIGSTFIVLKLLNGAAVGFTALITAVTFSASVILLSLGILGEYIGRIYAARTERPVYAVRELL
jgi:undecaprenyl-phosphate 4-deoxy-4-formamido-L-arabinose transferase